MSQTSATRTGTNPAPTPAVSRPSRFSMRRVAALARLEMTMLVRNRTALFNALALGPLLALTISTFQLPAGGEDQSRFAATMLVSLAVFALAFACFYNLCTTAVARREELMLKRLTTGELTRAEVLVAMAVPAFVVIVAQLVLGAAAVALLIGVPSVVNPLLLVLAVVLGFVALGALGYAMAIVTRSVESAQITTLLPLGALMFLSGSTLPLAMMPPPMRTAAELSPLGAVNELMNLGLSGTTADGGTVDLAGSFGAAVVPVLVLAAWTVVGGYLVRSRLPWEPRR